MRIPVLARRISRTCPAGGASGTQLPGGWRGHRLRLDWRPMTAELPLPGHGQTARRWAVLAAVAEQNLTVARVLEAHSDALAILAEAGAPAPSGTWGVFAAEAQPHRLTATESAQDGQVNLTGVKPWCSLAGQLDCALVTAHGPGGRQLYRVSCVSRPSPWTRPAWWPAGCDRDQRGRAVDGTPGQPAGNLAVSVPAWARLGRYRVAACWLGGAAGLRTAIAPPRQRNSDLTAMLLGDRLPLACQGPAPGRPADRLRHRTRIRWRAARLAAALVAGRPSRRSRTPVMPSARHRWRSTKSTLADRRPAPYPPASRRTGPGPAGIHADPARRARGDCDPPDGGDRRPPTRKST
jgi:hypothetical protein